MMWLVLQQHSERSRSLAFLRAIGGFSLPVCSRRFPCIYTDLTEGCHVAPFAEFIGRLRSEIQAPARPEARPSCSAGLGHARNGFGRSSTSPPVTLVVGSGEARVPKAMAGRSFATATAGQRSRRPPRRSSYQTGPLYCGRACHAETRCHSTGKSD